MLRRSAARSIGKIAMAVHSGGPTISLTRFQEAIPVLIQVLESSAEADDTRREAAVALGQIGDRSAQASLSKCTSSHDPYLAQSCKAALSNLQVSQ
jgi:HEAT repeat protein